MSDHLVIDLDITMKKVVAVLEKTDKPSAFTGGLAAITYGDPLMTNDVDLILDINPWEKDFSSTLETLLGNDFFSVSKVAERRLKNNQCSKQLIKRRCSK